MRATIITACSGAASFIGSFAMPVVFPHIDPIVAKALLWIAGALLLTAIGFWLAGLRKNEERMAGPTASAGQGGYAQAHSGAGNNVMMPPPPPLHPEEDQARREASIAEANARRVAADYATARKRESDAFFRHVDRSYLGPLMPKTQQTHYGSGHNIKADTVNIGSQFLEASDGLFEHLTKHIRAGGNSSVAIHTKGDAASQRIGDAAEVYFKRAGLGIANRIDVIWTNNPWPRSFFINALETKDGVAAVYFDGGTPLDRFEG